MIYAQTFQMEGGWASEVMSVILPRLYWRLPCAMRVLC
jgi:hypothetical protein